jgi:hypothetical protein
MQMMPIGIDCKLTCDVAAGTYCTVSLARLSGNAPDGEKISVPLLSAFGILDHFIGTAYYFENEKI